MNGFLDDLSFCYRVLLEARKKEEHELAASGRLGSASTWYQSENAAQLERERADVEKLILQKPTSVWECPACLMDNISSAEQCESCTTWKGSGLFNSPIPDVLPETCDDHLKGPMSKAAVSRRQVRLPCFAVCRDTACSGMSINEQVVGLVSAAFRVKMMLPMMEDATGEASIISNMLDTSHGEAEYVHKMSSLIDETACLEAQILAREGGCQRLKVCRYRIDRLGAARGA